MREAARQRAKAIAKPLEDDARAAARESGVHNTWKTKAAAAINREADEAAARGDLHEYVDELRSIAETYGKKGKGHRGGISGRGTR